MTIPPPKPKLDTFFRTLFDQTVNGLVIGNIYALIALGIALIFGVGNLINFAQGSIFMVGAYVGWWCVTRLQMPLPVAFVAVAFVCTAIGMLMERFALRPLQGAARIAPLLATIGIAFILDQLVQIVFSPNPQSFRNPLPTFRLQIGSGTIGAIDLLIAFVGITSALALFLFLRHTKIGWAIRATAQDRDAAQQMGVNVNAVNQVTFAIASVLGGFAGLLVGIYFQTVYPTMSYQAGLKGFAAVLLGGLGNVPGAIAGGLILGLVESYGVALLGPSYRNLFAFLILIAVLIWRPNGIFAKNKKTPPEPLTGTFIPNQKPVPVPRWLILLGTAAALALPVFVTDPYLLQILTNAWLLSMIALSITLATGTAGVVTLGQAGFVAIGAYASALITQRLGWSFELSLVAAAMVSAVLGVILTLPAFRLRAHYVAIATLAIGEIVTLFILNADWLTNGPLGITNIAPPTFFGIEAISARDVYWYSLGLLLIVALIQWQLVRSPLGRTWRAIREDDIAAQAYGINLTRYKALVLFISAMIAGVSGAFTAHMYTFINQETFTGTTSVLALTMVILGGMGNILGAIVGALLLTVLPEALRGFVDYRYLIYGIVLLLLIRFRPQGLLGTE